MTSTETTSKSPTYDLSDLTFILHYRKDSEDREHNLRVILKFLSENFDNSNLIVVNDFKLCDDNHDTRWTCQEFNTVNITIFNYDEFKKAYSYNYAAKHSPGDILCFWDVDVLIRPEFIVTAYNEIKNGTASHIYPFNGTFIDVQKSIFDRATKYDFDYLEWHWKEKTDAVQFASGESPGGCNLISREAFERMGGYDERFIGWGFEDTDYFYRSQKVNTVARLMMPDAICWHLHHDQAIRTENPHYENNLRIFNANRLS